MQDRFEILRTANDALQLAAEDLLPWGDQEGKVAVYFAHHNRIEQGVIHLKLRGIEVTEDYLYEVARYYRLHWRIDARRSVRPRCAICRMRLPAQEEALCKCFREAEEATYVEPTRYNIEQLKHMDPDGWSETIMQTVVCKNRDCMDLVKVTAGVVNSRFRKNPDMKTWMPPSLCYQCHLDKKQPTQQTRSSYPPARPNKPQTRSSVPPPAQTQPKKTLADLQAAVDKTAPIVPES